MTMALYSITSTLPNGERVTVLDEASSWRVALNRGADRARGKAKADDHLAPGQEASFSVRLATAEELRDWRAKRAEEKAERDRRNAAMAALTKASERPCAGCGAVVPHYKDGEPSTDADAYPQAVHNDPKKVAAGATYAAAGCEYAWRLHEERDAALRLRGR